MKVLKLKARAETAFFTNNSTLLSNLTRLMRSNLTLQQARKHRAPHRRAAETRAPALGQEQHLGDACPCGLLELDLQHSHLALRMISYFFDRQSRLASLDCKKTRSPAARGRQTLVLKHSTRTRRGCTSFRCSFLTLGHVALVNARTSSTVFRLGKTKANKPSDSIQQQQ